MGQTPGHPLTDRTAYVETFSSEIKAILIEPFVADRTLFQISGVQHPISFSEERTVQVFKTAPRLNRVLSHFPKLQG